VVKCTTLFILKIQLVCYIRFIKGYKYDLCYYAWIDGQKRSSGVGANCVQKADT